jgi:uncharacterized protein
LKRNIRVLVLLLTPVLLVAVQPVAAALGEWNRHIDFGKTIRELEEVSNKAIGRFLAMDSSRDLLVNMLVVAVLPAIAEEFFFRGALQNILERWTKRPVIAILCASLFFALFHLSFYKIFPIFLFGVALGVLFYITRNLWYSILFHFLNNTMALLATYYAQHNEFMKRLAAEDMEVSPWLSVAGLAVTLAIFYVIRRKIPYQPLDRPWLQNSFSNEFNNPR